MYDDYAIKQKKFMLSAKNRKLNCMVFLEDGLKKYTETKYADIFRQQCLKTIPIFSLKSMNFSSTVWTDDYEDRL